MGAGILVWVSDNGIPESSLRYEGQADFFAAGDKGNSIIESFVFI
jgi:hypothetical protein